MNLIFKINQFNHGDLSTFIVGNIPQLGSWDPKNSIQFQLNSEGSFQTQELYIPNISLTDKIEYKFIICKIYQNNEKAQIQWENGANKVINLRKDFETVQYKQNEELKVQVIVEDKGFNIQNGLFPKINHNEIRIVKYKSLNDEIKKQKEDFNLIDNKIQTQNEIKFNNQKYDVSKYQQSVTNQEIYQKNESKQLYKNAIQNIHQEREFQNTQQFPKSLNYQNSEQSQGPFEIANQISKIEYQSKSQKSQQIQIKNTKGVIIDNPNLSHQTANFNNTEESLLAYQEIIQNIQGQEYLQNNVASDNLIQNQQISISDQQIIQGQKQFIEQSDIYVDINNQQYLNEQARQASNELPMPTQQRVIKNQQELKSKKDYGLQQKTVSTGGTTSGKKKQEQNINQAGLDYFNEPSNFEEAPEPIYRNPSPIQTHQMQEEYQEEETDIQRYLKETDGSINPTINSKKAQFNEIFHQVQNQKLQNNIDSQMQNSEENEIIMMSESVVQNSQMFQNGIVLESMTGPQCQIDEIDDFSQATIGLLKDAVCHCLNLADWVQRHHVQLFYQGLPLLDDEGILEEYDIKGGAKISYIIMIA